MYPPIYCTKKFTLRAYCTSDEDRFVEMALDALSVRYMGGATGIEAKERQLFKKCFGIYANGESERWFWIWGISSGNELCGHLELKDSEHTRADELEMVYMVHPKARNRGLMTDVLSFLKAQQHVWQRKIIATVSPDNQRSLAVLNKWGITHREKVLNKETGMTYHKVWLSS